MGFDPGSPGLDPGSPGLRPGSKAGAKPLRHPGIPDKKIPMLVVTAHQIMRLRKYFKHSQYVSVCICLADEKKLSTSNISVQCSEPAVL